MDRKVAESLSLSVALHLSPSLSLSLSVSLFLSLSVSISLSMYPSPSIPIHPSIHTSICQEAILLKLNETGSTPKYGRSRVAGADRCAVREGVYFEVLQRLSEDPQSTLPLARFLTSAEAVPFGLYLPRAWKGNKISSSHLDVVWSIIYANHMSIRLSVSTCRRTPQNKRGQKIKELNISLPKKKPIDPPIICFSEQ